MVGFSSLTSRLQPHEAIRIIDHFHALIDEVFTHPDIFLMERTSSGCIAASGLIEAYPETSRSGANSQLSMTDSSYGSVTDLIDSKPTTENTPNLSTTHTSSAQQRNSKAQQQSPAHFTGLVGSAALQLMSASTRVAIPASENQQLQLRIALHSGPCSAGVVGLQTASGVSRIPHYKLFGLPLQYTHNLCKSGLAMQIRVSKACHELLESTGLFHFERCPDYTLWSAKKPIESFWLVGREGMDLTLPSIEHALPLTEYDDIEI